MIRGSIILIHPWTKEERQVPVERVTRLAVFVRWGQCGMYQLKLATNELLPVEKRAKFRAKGKARWGAKDIEEVRKRVKVFLDREDKRVETDKRIERHVASMPKPQS